ncbi:efflux RND transporter periplasmic adaptor subunit [Oharaeibacter diazotrophicus]|uniref:RND family efflux transporter MFP subunit n=2 Tax=Oharaeibacter diazotrophicus TaxID=1920512 RepID=A0A4R6RGG6_9HYPH|nr:efflux RND transporter periplasmic adaptor subunit [Oharaeibacter diazotrophicus]TDP85334.1 RND family efflux transporter MFP subunit [Oharaeibacter diazotrophicus]BBE74304.1 multidrug resistance protein MdtA precursor [Pleomorphomonas sp. SM30]GLS76005.1 hypothetical protein GCM10007904_13400 [Oharaeibacter diazotrophicus]
MAVWKQVVLVCVLAVAGVFAWGAYDPSARATLAGLGVPEAALPAWAFLARPEADAAAGPATAGAGKRPAGGGQAGGVQAGAAQGGSRSGGGQGGGRGGPSGPITVVAAPASTQKTNDRVVAIGTAEAARTVTLFPRSTGEVTEIGFRPGEVVKAGAVLVRLDDDAEKIALAKAELTLSDARAKATRYETLAGSRAISAVDRDTARSELQAAELAVRDARLALDRRVILAPYAGVVGLTTVEVGAMVSSTTEIVTLDERATLKIEFRIPEAFASKVALGQSVSAVTPARPGDDFEGEVTALGSRVESDSRTLVVQAALDNAADLLRPGMSFHVTLRFSGDDEIAVPALSVQWDRDGSYVWRVKDGAVERVAVRIVERSAETVLVDGDLAAGDTVVVEGVQRLRPGAKVALADAARGDGPAAATPPAPAGTRG